MKKVISMMALMIVSAIFCIFTIKNVKAETLEMRYQNDIYYVHVNDDGTGYSSYQLAMFYVDGKLAYCVEPGLAIYSTKYDVGGWDVTSLSPEQRKRIELIGYYGYEYPTHQGNVKYYMAAQELIWKAAKPLSATWSTQKRGGGQIINIEAEKNEIERLISNHLTKPDFNNKTINGVIGDTISLVDSNNVLSEFSVYDASSNDVQINGNRLDIKVNRTGENQIKFIRKNYDNDINLVYYNSNSQKLAHTRLSDPVTAKLNLNIVAGTVKINKLDKDTNKNKAQGEGSLKGAVYDIFNENDEYITSVTTDELGQAVSVNLPSLGHYYLKEKTPSKGYTLDETKYEFDMTKENLNQNINVYEKVISKSYDITKVYACNKTGIMIPEQNVEFGIYDKNNKLVLKKTTDKDGKIYFTLPYGSYTLRQLTTTKGYEKIEDYNFEIKDVGEKVNKIFSNAKITSKIKIIKVDENDQRVKKAGIKFKIKNIDTNKYVCQKITYPNEKTICEYETTSDGTLITPYPLNYGNYQVEEVDEKITGYLWNKIPLKFSINENSTIVKNGDDSIIELRFKNTEVKGKITINKFGEKFTIEKNKYSYTTKKLENVLFGVYDEDKNLIKRIYTDKNGYAEITNLKLGVYYIKELQTPKGYILDNKEYKIELTYKDQYTSIVTSNINLKNYLEKGTLEFTKTDVSTSEALPNTLIEIYNENDELIFSGRTNENGKIIIPGLRYGKYYIVEKKATEGYNLNPNKMWFEILEDGKVVKSTMTDEKMVVEVPNTNKNDNLVLGMISLISLGLGCAIYGTIKSKKRKK